MVAIKSLAFLLATTSSLSGQPAPLKVKEDKPGLLKQAKVTPEAALATAAAKVPGGTLKGAEIENEDGKLLFVFSFAKSGMKGEEEVSVDAHTGALHKVEHESAEDEAREAADEAKVKAKTSAPAGASKAAPSKPPVKKPPVG